MFIIWITIRHSIHAWKLTFSKDQRVNRAKTTIMWHTTLSIINKIGTNNSHRKEANKKRDESINRQGRNTSHHHLIESYAKVRGWKPIEGWFSVGMLSSQGNDDDWHKGRRQHWRLERVRDKSILNK